MRPPIHPTTSQFSNFRLTELRDFVPNAPQEGFGSCSLQHIQLCPQTPDIYSESLLDIIQNHFPNTKFRLHANIRVKAGVQFIDASSYDVRNHWYFERVSQLSNYIRAPMYSLHAGKRSNCSMFQLFQNIEKIQRLFDIPVLVEGMYPTTNNAYLVANWKEYRMFKDSGFPYALDMSHLNIVSNKEGQNVDLVYDLIAHENCMEIHISHNNGRADAHQLISEGQWQNLWWKNCWLEALKHRTTIPEHFTEGMHQMRSHRYYTNKRTTTDGEPYVNR